MKVGIVQVECTAFITHYVMYCSLYTSACGKFLCMYLAFNMLCQFKYSNITASYESLFPLFLFAGQKYALLMQFSVCLVIKCFLVVVAEMEGVALKLFHVHVAVIPTDSY